MCFVGSHVVVLVPSVKVPKKEVSGLTGDKARERVAP